MIDQEKSSPLTEDTKTSSECTVLKQDNEDEDKFDDFAEFNSSPSNNTEVISENNESDEKNPDLNFADPTEDNIIKSESTVIKHDDDDDDDDFDDFADFDSAAQRDADRSESDGQFAAFSGEATGEDSGNWASFQETTENTVAKDDTENPKDEWSNQGSGQWKVGEEDEWQEGGGDDFGDFGDFDEPEPPQPRQSEKVNYIYRNDSYTVGQRNDLSKDHLLVNRYECNY